MFKQTIILRISKILANRRVVYFQKYPNSKMQQTIIEAEKTMVMLKKLDDNTFNTNIKIFANKYILPLIPSQNSRYYNIISDTYNTIINL